MSADDSIELFPPTKKNEICLVLWDFLKKKNSGRPQGKLVCRHKVLKSGHEKDDDENPQKFWHWKDLNVASDVDIFGRRFRLTNCNQWTRVHGRFNLTKQQNNICIFNVTQKNNRNSL